MSVSLKIEPHIKVDLSISLDIIIVLAPSKPHLKGLGMRNLQYWVWIFQKSHNTVTNHNYILCVVRILMIQTLLSDFSAKNQNAISKKFWPLFEKRGGGDYETLAATILPHWLTSLPAFVLDNLPTNLVVPVPSM